jgi:hypothetical protein
MPRPCSFNAVLDCAELDYTSGDREARRVANAAEHAFPSACWYILAAGPVLELDPDAIAELDPDDPIECLAEGAAAQYLPLDRDVRLVNIDPELADRVRSLILLRVAQGIG